MNFQKFTIEELLLFNIGGGWGEEEKFLNFVQSKNLRQNVYVKKIGFVTMENLNISVENKKLCNLRVDDLTKKFNNSISSCVQ